MRRFILVVLLGFCAADAFAEQRVRIATYNIFFLKASIPDARANRIREVIQKLDADVIGLQEIDDRAALERVFDPTKWLLVIDDDSNDSQDVALAVRKPLEVLGLNSDPNDLDADDNDFLFSGAADNSFFPGRRDVLCVRVRLPNNGADFFVLVEHPKARVGGRNVTDPRREGAARMLLHKLEQDFDEKRYFVLGDLNDNGDDVSLNILETGDPNAVGGSEEIEGPFLINLTEPLLVDDHVSWGLKESDISNGVLNTIRPGSRALNNAQRGQSGSVAPILFDQILIPLSMRQDYVPGSAAVFGDPVAVEGGNANQGRASDHVPVFADFIFDVDTDQPANPVPGGTSSVKITAVLPNPEGTDAGKEWVKLKNFGSTSVDLTGWRLRDRASNVFPVSGSLGAGEEKRIVLESNSMPLNNNGDLVLLIRDNGIEHHRLEYSGTQAPGAVVMIGQ